MTHPTRTLGLSVAAGLLAAGPALGQAPVIDGTIDKAYGPALQSMKISILLKLLSRFPPRPR